MDLKGIQNFKTNIIIAESFYLFNRNFIDFKLLFCKIKECVKKSIPDVIFDIILKIILRILFFLTKLL